MTEQKIPDWAKDYKDLYLLILNDEELDQAAKDDTLERIRTAFVSSPAEIEKMAEQISDLLKNINSAKSTDEVQTLIWWKHPDRAEFFLSACGRWDEDIMIPFEDEEENDLPGVHKGIDDTPLERIELFHVEEGDTEVISTEEIGPVYHQILDDFITGFDCDSEDIYGEAIWKANHMAESDFEIAKKIAFEKTVLDNPKWVFPIKNFDGDTGDSEVFFANEPMEIAAPG